MIYEQKFEVNYIKLQNLDIHLWLKYKHTTLKTLFVIVPLSELSVVDGQTKFNTEMLRFGKKVTLVIKWPVLIDLYHLQIDW